MRAHELFEAPSTDVATQAGLINFLKGAGFVLTSGQTGTKNFHKGRSARAAINTLKKTWKPIDSSQDAYSKKEKLSAGEVTINVTTFDDGSTYVSWPMSAFNNPDSTNIYKVTKHHPAWGYVQDYLDQTGNRSKESVKAAVDSFMTEFGYTPETLKAQIVQRTKDNKVHSLYGTD